MQACIPGGLLCNVRVTFPWFTHVGITVIHERVGTFHSFPVSLLNKYVLASNAWIYLLLNQPLQTLRHHLYYFSFIVSKTLLFWCLPQGYNPSWPQIFPDNFLTCIRFRKLWYAMTTHRCPILDGCVWFFTQGLYTFWRLLKWEHAVSTITGAFQMPFGVCRPLTPP